MAEDTPTPEVPVDAPQETPVEAQESPVETQEPLQEGPKRESFNYMTAAGKVDIDDAEMLETMGLDQRYAYTPEINKVLLEHNLRLVRENMKEDGHSDKEIEIYVQSQRQSVMANIRAAESIAGKKLI